MSQICIAPLGSCCCRKCCIDIRCLCLSMSQICIAPLGSCCCRNLGIGSTPSFHLHCHSDRAGNLHISNDFVCLSKSQIGIAPLGSCCCRRSCIDIRCLC